MLAAGWFAACSSDDDIAVDVPDTPSAEALPMTFGGSLDEGEEATTRADQGLEEVGHNIFTVYGNKYMTETGGTYSGVQNVFPGYTVTHANSVWTYDNTNGQTIKYWDMNAKAYMFAAYAPVNATTNDDTNVDVTVANNDKIQFEVPVNAATENDIKATRYFSKKWFSADLDAQFNKPVEMQFVHPFVRVRFMFIDESGNPLTTTTPVVQLVNKSSIMFAPADQTLAETEKTTNGVLYRGYVTVTYPLGTATEETYEYKRYDATGTNDKWDALTVPYETTNVLTINATDLNKWYTLLPNISQGAFKMSLIVNNTTRSAIVPAEYMKWNVGYQYTYVFKLSAESLAFQPSLFLYDKWQAGYTDETTW